MPDEKRIETKYIEGDIWLSRQSVKGILADDLAKLIKYGRNMEKIAAVKEYINQLTYRLDHMRV